MITGVLGSEHSRIWERQFKDHIRINCWLMPYPSGTSLISHGRDTAGRIVFKWWSNYSRELEKHLILDVNKLVICQNWPCWPKARWNATQESRIMRGRLEPDTELAYLTISEMNDRLQQMPTDNHELANTDATYAHEEAFPDTSLNDQRSVGPTGNSVNIEHEGALREESSQSTSICRRTTRSYHANQDMQTNTQGNFSSFRLYDQKEELSKLDQDDRRIATSSVQRNASNLVIVPWDGPYNLELDRRVRQIRDTELQRSLQPIKLLAWGHTPASLDDNLRAREQQRQSTLMQSSQFSRFGIEKLVPESSINCIEQSSEIYSKDERHKRPGRPKKYATKEDKAKQDVIARREKIKWLWASMKKSIRFRVYIADQR
ncbi:hypothetical protein GGI35DRAFT_347353 [Trichoderma velutinum]